jgi:hypothetical protein
VRRLSGPFGPRSSHRPVLPPIRRPLHRPHERGVTRGFSRRMALVSTRLGGSSPVT